MLLQRRVDCGLWQSPLVGLRCQVPNKFRSDQYSGTNHHSSMSARPGDFVLAYTSKVAMGFCSLLRHAYTPRIGFAFQFTCLGGWRRRRGMGGLVSRVEYQCSKGEKSWCCPRPWTEENVPCEYSVPLSKRYEVFTQWAKG